MKIIFKQKSVLFRFGLINLIIALLLLFYCPFNHIYVLGINAVIKPIKFALSIWIFCWTTDAILYYFNDEKKNKSLYSSNSCYNGF